MSRKQKERNRELIQSIKEMLIEALRSRLSCLASSPRITAKEASTGSVYVRVNAGGKHNKTTVRISDHRKHPSDRWVNFSRPVKGWYGIWCYTKPADIGRKAERIADHIIQLDRKWGEA